MNKRFRLRAGALALAGVLAASLLGANPALAVDEAPAPQTATIAGTASLPSGVTRPSSSSVSVTVYSADRQRYVDFQEIAADGTYRVTGLEPGSYKLVFESWNVNALPQWYSGKDTWDAATPVAVTAGQTLENIDITFQKGGAISGTVTPPRDAKLSLSKVMVEAWSANSEVLLARGYADSKGVYSLGGLPSGSYKLYARATESKTSVIAQWYSGKTSWATASTVKVSAGAQVTGRNFAMKAGGSLSGTVTFTKLKTTPTYVHTFRKNSNGTWTPGTSAAVSSNGTYKVLGLVAGNYAVVFTNSKTTRAWKDKPDRYSANLVTVAVGKNTSGVNASLDKKLALVTPKSTTPKISGTAKVGKKLTAKRGTWMDGLSYSYRWYANGKVISGATKSTLTLTKSHKGKTIKVKVTGKRAGYKTIAKTSKATSKIK